MDDARPSQENMSEKSTLESVKAVFRLRMERPSTITTYLCLLLSVMLASLAVSIYLLSLPLNREIKVNNYGNRFGCHEVLGLETACQTTIHLEEDMEGPVLVRYELTDFISNSKDYITSKSRQQLMGNQISKAQAQKCQPYVTNAQMGVTKSWGGYPLNPEAIASPCGLQAKLYFKDSFELITTNYSVVPIRTNNIIDKFIRQANSQEVQWIDPTLDSFELWMTTNISPTLLKLYGVIDTKIPRGNYTLRIKNRSNYSMEVQKNVMLVHEASEYGNGRLLGFMFLGGSMLLLAFVLAYYCFEYAIKKCVNSQ